MADWVAEARRLVPEIAARGRLPLLVGGSGLYVDALLDGYAFELPPQPAQRARLAAELAAVGVGPLADRLRRVDPVGGAAHRPAQPAARDPRAGARRHGRRGSGAGTGAQPWPGRVARIGLCRPREVLYRRIDERAAWLFANGLLDEVRALLEAGHDPRRAPLTGHGYGEAARYLAGEWSLEEAVAMTARRTRQYAKRQSTWFGRDRRIVWLPAGDLPGDDPGLVDEADRMLRALLA